MAMADSPRSNSGSNWNVSIGPDYEVLWKRLEQKLREIRQNTSDAICVENDVDKARILRGSWGAYGLVVNTMSELLGEARGIKPTEEER